MITANRARPWLQRLALGGAAFLALTIPIIATSGGASGRPAALPEFKRQSADAWINSAPITTAALRGKVVLLEVYTSG